MLGTPTHPLALLSVDIIELVDLRVMHAWSLFPQIIVGPKPLLVQNKGN